MVSMKEFGTDCFAFFWSSLSPAQLLADHSPGEGEHPVDDEGEGGPRVTQHVDVGAHDATDPWQVMLQPSSNTN